MPPDPLTFTMLVLYVSRRLLETCTLVNFSASSETQGQIVGRAGNWVEWKIFQKLDSQGV